VRWPESSIHFVDAANMLSVTESTPIQKVLTGLSELGRSGFVLEDRTGRLRYYLASDVLGKLIGQVDLGPRKSLKAMLTTFEASRSLEVERLQLPKRGGGTLEAKLRHQPDKVYILMRDTRLLGYFLNHETVVATYTQPVYYICSNGHRRTVCNWVGGKMTCVVESADIVTTG
jgi:hypothetical protein